MFCGNCGHKLDENVDFCPECGTKVYKIEPEETLSKKLAKNNPLKPLLKKTRSLFSKVGTFIFNHKRPFVVGGSFCLVLLIGLILFNHLYDFTKLSWDKENGDFSVTYTQGGTLTLNVLAYDKKNNPITEIEFSAEDGEIESDGATVKWNLPSKEGNYTITAKSPSGKKITKDINIIKVNNQVLGGVEAEEVDDNTADNDNDGITNAEEMKLGTNPNLADTDRDGLIDYYEINVSKTNPLKADTDGDGINDGDELGLNLDPLKIDSLGDGIKDGERILTFNVDESNLGVNVEITGKGNIASTTIDVFKNSAFSDKKGLIDKVYNFYTTGTIDKAVVRIDYDLDELNAKGIKEDDLILYYFNDKTKELEPQATQVDKENKQIIVNLSHFSRYIVGDSTVNTKEETEIMFVIDNSVSMYTEKQMIDAGYDSSQGAIGNDSEYKRLKLTNKLIDMFTGNYKFGIAEFSGNYVNLKTFSNNTDSLKQSVNSMKSNWHSNADGTNIIVALKEGINEFQNTDKNNYLILLTDGKNTEGSLSNNRNTIISKANSKNVKICIIGLGNSIDDEELSEISENTGCGYYSATDSSALDEIYSKIGADLNYNYVDTEDDNNTDGIIIDDSGFLVNRDGFSFANFSSNKSDMGNCYGMATFAMLYYKGNDIYQKTYLPLSLSKRTLNSGKGHWESNGYDLVATYFEGGNNLSGNNLYDFKITNSALDIFLNTPSDYFYKTEDGILKVADKYKKAMSEIGITFITRDYNGNGFSKYEKAILNVDNDTFNNAVSNEEAQLFNAIWRLYILQANHDLMGFSASPDAAYIRLRSSLTMGIPQVIMIGETNISHAINAIRLIQDTNDANKFKLEVYDNNFPGETRYITMTRSKMRNSFSITSWTNEYEYTFTYDKDNDGKDENIVVFLSTPIIE